MTQVDCPNGSQVRDQGSPRTSNQLCTQAMIQAAVLGRDDIHGDFMAGVIQTHPLFQHAKGTDR